MPGNVEEPQPPDPNSVAERMGRAFFGATSDPASIRRAVRGWLMGAATALVVAPLIFYLRFGYVPDLGWGLTAFLTVYCLLSAVGVYYLRRPAYHTPVALRGGLADRVGAFWLVACAFGPLLGWFLTNAFPLTPDNWRWLYAARVFLSIALPVLTALPLLRYVRGKGALIMLAILLGVTALPIWSAWSTCQDLAEGPVQRSVRMIDASGNTAQVPYLQHTGQTLKAP
jgi:hypothetical protein